jgi:hypothetical protein
MPATDSAGVPWEGRRFHDNGWGSDDGSAPPRLLEALRRFRSNEVGESEVLEALRDSRLLIPLVAELGESGTNAHGQLVDKSQELSIVTVRGPDGRDVLPAFTSVEAMQAWNPKSRPVPTPAVRVALAAAGEGTDLIVLDPTSPTEFAVRRPAVWALARGEAWTPSAVDPEVRAEFERSVAAEADVVAVTVVPGDPEARLAGPELLVFLGVRPGLDAAGIGELVSRVQSRWGTVITERVDSLAVRIEALP